MSLAVAEREGGGGREREGERERADNSLACLEISHCPFYQVVACKQTYQMCKYT